MKQDVDDVYGRAAEGALPLFDEGPFSHSPIDPEPVEKVVAGLIWQRDRVRPIAIREITAATGMSERAVKETVEQLRTAHRCAIGAARQEPFGYFWIRSAEDREIAVRPYREQIFTMLRTLRVLDSPAALREFLGQLRLEVEREV